MDARSIDKLRQAIGANRPFQPDTDANDDYAVLEWMRDWRLRGIPESTLLSFNDALKRRWDFTSAGDGTRDLQYVVGDYAKACLRVLDEQ